MPYNVQTNSKNTTKTWNQQCKITNYIIQSKVTRHAKKQKQKQKNMRFKPRESQLLELESK